MRTVQKVKIGAYLLGQGEPVRIQSMLSVPAQDIQGNVEQARRLEESGCEIVRVSVPNLADVALVKALKKTLRIPLVADIHFDYRIAVACAEAGIDKIRINPGNIGGEDRVAAVVTACKKQHIPIRIGVNSGSLEKDLLDTYGGPTPQALCESAMRHVRLLEKFDFTDIILSIKSSDVHKMIQSYQLMASLCGYPLHLGVTEAGTPEMGIVKSSIGIGALLADGIGETIRVSLTSDPCDEIKAARNILKALRLRSFGVHLVSCPTCGRTQIDLIALAGKVEKALESCDKEITVAVMGCAVNGPGEAREADLGVAGGNGEGLIFKKGEMIKKVAEDEIIGALLEQIERLDL